MNFIRIIPGIAAVTLLFSACSKPDTLGGRVSPTGDKANVYFIDTLSIDATTEIEKPIASSQNLYNLVGYYNDPLFGDVSASSYLQFSMPGAGADVSNIHPDSIVLCLAYPTNSLAVTATTTTTPTLTSQQFLYGDPNAQQVINVGEYLDPSFTVTPPFVYDSSYKSNHVFLGTVTPVGSATITPRPFSNVQIGNSSLVPHMRVKLDMSLATKLLNSSMYVDLKTFTTYFQGLYLSSPKSANGRNILYYNPTNTQTKISIYYKIAGQDTAVSLDFPITSYSNARVNHFEHNAYANASIKSAIGDKQTGKNLLYLQAMAGTKAKVIFPHFNNLRSLGKITINKAELVINAAVVPGNDTVLYKLPPQLYVVGASTDSSDVIILDQTESSTYYGGARVQNQYKINIARHLQKLLENPTIPDYGLYVIVAASAVSANRIVIGGPKNTTAAMKLNITYTKP